MKRAQAQALLELLPSRFSALNLGLKPRHHERILMLGLVTRECAVYDDGLEPSDAVSTHFIHVSRNLCMSSLDHRSLALL